MFKIQRLCLAELSEINTCFLKNRSSFTVNVHINIHKIGNHILEQVVKIENSLIN